MSIPERIFRLGKAYVNRMRERVDEWEKDLDSAEKELQSEADRPLPGETAPPRPRPTRDDSSTDAIWQRAEARIAAANRELTAREELTPAGRDSGATGAPASSTASSHAADPDAPHYRLLDVPPGADWSTVQSKYEKLARRCDPRRFPDGSTEQKEAQMIMERVNIAYEALRKRLDPTESRFAKLELDNPPPPSE